MNDLPGTKYQRLRPWLLLGIVWVVAFDVAWLWQRFSGAQANEFGAHPREGTHYVTGLMVRDFFSPENQVRKPGEFIGQYAAHYPNVDREVWPPFFYAVESAWMAAFGTKRLTLLMLMAAIAATTATLVTRILVKGSGAAVGVIASVTLLSLPLFRESYGVILAGPLAALLMLAAAWQWARYLDDGHDRNRVAFGVLTGMALLTDITAFALVLQAPISALCSGRLQRLWQPAVWSALIMVALIVAPIAGYALVGNDLFSWSFVREALPIYLGKLGLGIGFALLPLFIVGLVRTLRKGTPENAQWITFAATLAAAFLVLAVVSRPLDAMHLIPTLPLAILFAGAGLAGLCARIAKREAKPDSPAVNWAGTVFASLLAVAGVYTAELFRQERLPNRWVGFGEGADHIASQSRTGTRRVLISTDASGESALISEIARREKRPGVFVQKSNDELMRPDRFEGGTRPRFDTDEEVTNWFERSGITVVAVDHTIAEMDRSPAHDQLIRAAENHPDVFWPMAHVSIDRGSSWHEGVLTLYRVKSKEKILIEK